MTKLAHGDRFDGHAYLGLVISHALDDPRLASRDVVVTKCTARRSYAAALYESTLKEETAVS
jgi:hypothetical protein